MLGWKDSTSIWQLNANFRETGNVVCIENFVSVMAVRTLFFLINACNCYTYSYHCYVFMATFVSSDSTVYIIFSKIIIKHIIKIIQIIIMLEKICPKNELNLYQYIISTQNIGPQFHLHIIHQKIGFYIMISWPTNTLFIFRDKCLVSSPWCPNVKLVP